MESNLLCDVSKSRSFSWEWMTMLMHKVKWISGHWSILLFFSVRCFGRQIIYVNTLSILVLQKKQVILAAYEIWLWLDWRSSSVWKWLSACWTCDHCGGRNFNIYFRNGSFFVSPCLFLTLRNQEQQSGTDGLLSLVASEGLLSVVIDSRDGIRWAGVMLPISSLLKTGLQPHHTVQPLICLVSERILVLVQEFC